MKDHSTLRVAFQGERGAFSEDAIALLRPEAVAVPCGSFQALFHAIADGSADRILAPVENSLAGSVTPTYDLLYDSHLEIEAEVGLRVQHQLICTPDATLENISVVQSHPVALAQCERFFAAHPRIRQAPAQDTAGSVREIMEADDPTRAAIASERAAKTFGGKVLSRNIEDDPANFTRFFLLRRERAPGDVAGNLQQAGTILNDRDDRQQGHASRDDGNKVSHQGNKVSLAFELQHRPGALHAALQSFAERGIDLLKIESRPIKGRPWHYRFYLDLKSERHEAESALRQIQASTSEVRIFGCYRAWQQPAEAHHPVATSASRT